MIDLRNNLLQGKVPESLANCRRLEFLSVANNQLDDTFPLLLGTLPELRILLLRNNSFHGNIGQPLTHDEFPNLRIIDLSYNRFTGDLPAKHVESWKRMKNSSIIKGYMESIELHWNNQKSSDNIRFDYSVTITIKGLGRLYTSIQDALVVIDFSNKGFEGKIPEAFGRLKGLISLDLSNNNLIGVIPSCLADFSELESLDLSSNKHSGDIRQELTELHFLQYFNVSHNKLTGRIPQENQISRFESSAYEGNTGLCGILLRNKCGDSKGPRHQPSTPAEPEDEPLALGWKTVVIGYACGFLGGIFMAKIVVSRRQRWFDNIFRVRFFHAHGRRTLRGPN